MSAIKPKHQRLVLVAISMVALIVAALLAIWGLRGSASYFFVPADIAANPPAPDQHIRLGGMVEVGSLKTAADGVTISFTVADGKARVPVSFKGIVPDLFKEGSGVVAEGKLGVDGTFTADMILAKHDEKYVPREMRDMTVAQARDVVKATK